MKRPPYLKTSIGIGVLFIILMFLQSWLEKQPEALTASSEPETQTEATAVQPSERLVEDKRVYEGHNGTNLEHVYITIFDQSAVPENDITFYDLNESYKQYSNLDSGPKLDILFQTGTAKGPSDNGFISFGTDKPNATIELRGRSSRLEAQKSYKIRLQDNGGLWYGQSVINLNKHADDRTRVRNMLAFDYFRRIPDLISLRTNFVQLHVKDLTDPSSEGKFKSYGLYTHVEQLNEEALAARGLNPDGHLYKAENFEFYRYPDQLNHQNDPNYDKKKFEQVLKINGNENHDELLQMLDDINDLSKPFDEVFDTYFQEDNYLTWLAVNILFGNYDTMSTNYYLYSPLNSKKWYFIPWDFDKALGRDAERTDGLPQWQQGIQRYWGTVLHRRYLRDPENAAALTAKIEELSAIITEKTTKELIDSYYPVVKQLALQEPDLSYLGIEASEFDPAYRKLEQVTSRYKEQYMKSLEVPMPIFLHYERKNGRDVFTWEASHDLQNDKLSYEFQLSKTPGFESLIMQIKEQPDFTYNMAALPAGRYYWRVLVHDDKGHEQIPFDYYRDNAGIVYWGVQQIVVPGGSSS
ncbi:CotH kinase family protein [Domibacillus indicus]|uniref:CotH kinase family protein n=1 Tax=Domibacillus indicus TaxID=1437523 RepID=UPI00203BABAD|nr:CotH kinase family protein [Domibacillus indicus]MCM3790863.1 CotH kinase family protein [Domibacillus indicus]